MAAYVIGEVEIRDPEAYKEYARLAPATIAQYGGKYLVRGGTVDSREGGWSPSRVVVLEFPSMEQAQAWYHSAEYGPVVAIRHGAAASRMIIVDGVRP